MFTAEPFHCPISLRPLHLPCHHLHHPRHVHRTLTLIGLKALTQPSPAERSLLVTDLLIHRPSFGAGIHEKELRDPCYQSHEARAHGHICYLNRSVTSLRDWRGKRYCLPFWDCLVDQTTEPQVAVAVLDDEQHRQLADTAWCALGRVI